MDTQKNFFHLLGDWLAARQARRREAAAQAHPPRGLTGWLPSRGNVIFTLAMIALLVLAQSVGALPLGRPHAAPDAASTGTIAYQGRLADASGAPLTGTYNMIFRLYTVATGGTPLWTEQWIGSNAVRVSDGLFNVMLGSLIQLPVSQFTNSQFLYLGITVGTDDEMQPRVQLGSVPFAMIARRVQPSPVSPMMAGVISVPGELNQPDNDQWTDVAGWSKTITIESPATVFVIGTAFVGPPVGSICELRVVIGESAGTPVRYQNSWETVPLHHVVHVGAGTHTIKVQAKRVSGSGSGIIAWFSTLSYFVQPDPVE